MRTRHTRTVWLLLVHTLPKRRLKWDRPMARPPCYPVSEIYGLDRTKAVAIDLSHTFESEALNATVSLAEGWLEMRDNLLLEEKISSQENPIRQPAQVIKTFVHRDYYVVHTNLQFETWCTSDCGCVKKGYFGFDDPQGYAAVSATASFLRGGGLLAVIVILPLVCIALIFCTIRFRKLRKAAKYEEKRAPSSPGGPVLAHRPPPTPPGSAGGFGAAEGQGRLSLGNAGKMVVAAHRMAPTPPGGFGAAAQCMQPYARALAGPAYRPEAAAASNWLRLAQGQQLQQTAQATQAMQPRSPWAGSPQDVMRAQRALAAMMPGGALGSPDTPLPPIGATSSPAYPGGGGSCASPFPPPSVS